MIMTAVFLIICIAGAIGLTAAYLSSRESYQDERPEDDVPHQVQKDDSMSCRSGISMQNMSGHMVTKQDLRELESRILGRTDSSDAARRITPPPLLLDILSTAPCEVFRSPLPYPCLPPSAARPP